MRLSLIGIGEIVLLPLDVLKIKRQTNPEAFRGRGVIKIVQDEGFGLYRGWGWTAARNAPGSFAVSGRLRTAIYTYAPPAPQQGHMVTDVHIRAPASCLVVLPSPKSFSSSSRTTIKRRGSRTLWPRSREHQPRSLCRPRWTSSRPGSRTGISTTRRAASVFCPTWPGKRDCRASSRVWCPRYVMPKDRRIE